MGADYRAHIVDIDGLDPKAVPHHLSHHFGVLQTVAVANEHGLVGGVNSGQLHLIHQGLQCGGTATGLADVDEMTLVVHMDNGLDLKHGAHDGGGGGDTAAPLQKVEVVHRHLVADR